MRVSCLRLAASARAQGGKSGRACSRVTPSAGLRSSRRRERWRRGRNGDPARRSAEGRCKYQPVAALAWHEPPRARRAGTHTTCSTSRTQTHAGVSETLAQARPILARRLETVSIVRIRANTLHEMTHSRYILVCACFNSFGSSRRRVEAKLIACRASEITLTRKMGIAAGDVRLWTRKPLSYARQQLNSWSTSFAATRLDSGTLYPGKLFRCLWRAATGCHSLTKALGIAGFTQVHEMDALHEHNLEKADVLHLPPWTAVSSQLVRWDLNLERCASALSLSPSRPADVSGCSRANKSAICPAG